MLELAIPAPAPVEPSGPPAAAAGEPVVEATGSLILWEALAGVYESLGFTEIDDEAFRALVLGRIIEPTSKLDTIRVLNDIGVGSPSLSTFRRCLKRTIERGYRATIATACYRHATATGSLGLALYDVTTLYFETPREDGLRKVGMSKERRVDPQVTVGLLTTGSGFPLDVHLFEGNKAETKTIVPVLTEFRERHPDAGQIIVVADAGMLSAANLLALEDAGFCFIVGSRASKAPYDLADHLERHGNAFADGQTIETTRRMGTGKDARTRRVVWQWRFKRHRHDNQAINAMIDRAEAVAGGKRPLKKDRFVKLAGVDPVVDWDLVERARSLAGLKGYVTNIALDTMNGDQVSADYFAAVGDRLFELLPGPRQDANQPFVPILANACFGDINNIDVTRAARPTLAYQQVQAVADIVARSIYEIWRGIRYVDWVPLGVAEAMLEFAVRKPGAAEVAAAKEKLERAPQGPLQLVEDIYARETLQLADWPARFSTIVQALRVGDLGICALPGEPFAQTGLNIKAKSPFKNTMMIGMANDYAGYLPTEEQHALGGYETWRAKSSFLEITAATKIEAKALELLKQLGPK